MYCILSGHQDRYMCRVEHYIPPVPSHVKNIVKMILDVKEDFFVRRKGFSQKEPRCTPILY